MTTWNRKLDPFEMQDATINNANTSAYGAGAATGSGDLTATAGTRHFRYTEDEVGSQYKTTSGCINKPQGDCHVDAIDRHGTDSGFRSRAGLTWHVMPDAMLYYTFSQGFRPGAFNRVCRTLSPARTWCG